MAQSVRAHLRYSIDHEWLEDGEPARVAKPPSPPILEVR